VLIVIDAMYASSTKPSVPARRGVSERFAAINQHDSFGSFTAEDSDVFRSKFIDLTSCFLVSILKLMQRFEDIF